MQGGSGGGAGGNRTDGRHSVLGGNQIVAPITAPINACGNAVAVLGDAGAGCLGGASVGGPGRGHLAGNTGPTSSTKMAGQGVLPELPKVPGRQDVRDLARRSGGPVPGGAAAEENPAGAPSLSGKERAAGGAVDQARKVVSGTPAGAVVKSLPVGSMDLMSADRPIGLTGMNSGSVVALIVGGLFAAAAAAFSAGTRRLRPRRR
ncbi:chaplin family protein [Sphaerisporangium rufum]|uniref:chaplin family protein n=1 Tax=Sphaerisporangium rufum TaxID=1381558 RepID=UPI001EF259B2|nr:chaplin family protein [Sphaerisporangium rufum]